MDTVLLPRPTIFSSLHKLNFFPPPAPLSLVVRVRMYAAVKLSRYNVFGGIIAQLQTPHTHTLERWQLLASSSDPPWQTRQSASFSVSGGRFEMLALTGGLFWDPYFSCLSSLFCLFLSHILTGWSIFFEWWSRGHSRTTDTIHPFPLSWVPPRHGPASLG